MADKTSIEWTDATWNPIRGCSRVSEGCRNCYAEPVAARFSAHGQPYEGLAKRDAAGNPRWTGEVRLIEHTLDAPLRWRKPRRIFVNSMSDLFHEKVPHTWIDYIFAIMALCPQHTFQILTKRPQRLLNYFRFSLRLQNIVQQLCVIVGPEKAITMWEPVPWPLPNVWLGVSVEDQATTDERIPLLLQTPAAIRFISAEPLLGPLDISLYLTGNEDNGVDLNREPGAKVGACTGWTPALDWVIAGGESGPHARPMHPDWARTLRDQCAAASVPFFFKQWGEWVDVNQPNNEAIVMESHQRHFWPDKTGQMMLIGKKRAGALLDNAEHKAFPPC